MENSEIRHLWKASKPWMQRQKLLKRTYLCLSSAVDRLKIVVMVQEGEKGEFVNLVHTIRNSLAMNANTANVTCECEF